MGTIELIPVFQGESKKRLWQWDSNRQLKIRTTEEVTEAHFSLAGDKGAIPVAITEAEGYCVANIPNILLQKSGHLNVYVVANGVTIERHRIQIVKREKPSNYVYTETDVIPSIVRIGEVTLVASAWVGSESPYSQVVAIDGVTENTQVDLTPSVEQLAIFYEKDLAFVTENENGIVTVYAIGEKPQNDYTIQVTMTEVGYE